MDQERVQRRLAAVVAADVVGYSRLIGEDEEGTLARLRDLRTTLIDPKIAEHGGRIVKTMGDGILIEFDSAVAAVRNAVEVQQAIQRHNADLPAAHRVEFRVGANIGDIVVEGDDILGDGVNIAARLEGIAQPAGVCISQAVFDQVVGKLDSRFEDIGEPTLKNIDRPVRVYRLAQDQAHDAVPALPGTGESQTIPDRPSIAVLPFVNMSGDPDQEYFSDSISEDIITALSSVRWFFVIARNSSFAYKDNSPDMRLVAAQLGVAYLLEGSVRKRPAIAYASAPSSSKAPQGIMSGRGATISRTRRRLRHSG